MGFLHIKLQKALDSPESIVHDKIEDSEKPTEVAPVFEKKKIKTFGELDVEFLEKLSKDEIRTLSRPFKSNGK